jgi:carbonic anhydrase
MAAPAPGAADPAWHYEGDEGPANWGKLSPKFAVCASGREQSPIDIVKPLPVKDAAALGIRFSPAALKIAHLTHVADGINNGHTIQINYPGGDTLSIGDASYALVQYHFHGPSEHTVNGKHFPMEMHFVHKATDGKLAVIGVLIAEGAHNAAFDPIWANLPARKGDETHYPAVNVDVDRLLPSTRTSYRYDGSLTTPPCAEGVKWIVMTTPIELSAAQIGAFTSKIQNNNRPVQGLNGRRVVIDGVGETR